MKLARDIQSLSTFKRDTSKLMRQMRKTKQPMVLTVNGRAALVVQDTESYQRLLEAKERMEAMEGIQRGLESMKAKHGMPARKFFAGFFAKNGLSEDE
jgi:prevent-host-death family protein